MEILKIVLLMIVGFGGGFVQRVSGFGLGIFVMLFLPYLTPDIASAATISCLFSCGTSTYNAVKYRKDVSFKVVLPLICSALVAIPLAVRLSVNVSAKFFTILLGIVLILLSIYFLFFDKRIKMKPTFANSIIAGGLGGTLNGLFSTGGPPIVLYLSHAIQSNIKYFATIQFYFAVTNIYATVFRIANGIVSLDIIYLAVVGFLGCMAGDMAGKFVFDKLDGKKLRFVIYIGMIISGFLMIF